MPHIVDQLIEERASGLRSRPMLWGSIRRFLYPILDYRSAILTIDTLQNMDGRSVFEWLSRRLHMRVEVEGLEHLPKSGRVIIVANHPAGIADGIAMWDALKFRREDVTFFANRDAIRAVPGLADIIIPVEWLEERRSRERSKETVRHMIKAFRDERVIVIFPSGRLAKPTLAGLVERPWMPSAISLAQKYNCPIVPIHISGRSSWLYYLFYFISSELRDMTLFRELFNKRGARYALKVGMPFEAAGETQALSDQVRSFVAERMPKGAVSFQPDHETQQPAQAQRTNGNSAD
ncbi:MAG: 1-acyl-sn-glycerol-3-phosphate acyltransferase [Pseudomonadales bacterium]